VERQNRNGKPRGLVVAGLGGGSGKSVVAVGLAAAFAGKGRKVIPFKKGPDYIDAGWLALAAATPCYNLDPFLMTPASIRASFQQHARQGEMVIVEGNRGLYDGVDAEGSCSTAELAKALGLPVLLVVDCTKTTRTVAALVLGCRMLDPEVRIAGVILNRIGTDRHGKIVREAVEKYASVPVLGIVRRSRQDVFPQRHLGITPCPEHAGADEAVQTLAAMAERDLDLAAIEGIMGEVEQAVLAPETLRPEPRVRVGILKDPAFQFYYAENLEALKNEGAELVKINALTCPELPELDALYIGGGFPETSARELSANVSFRESVKAAAEAGLPIYAECGGLIYLGRAMVLSHHSYPLAGVFPVEFGIGKSPQAHGYTVLESEGGNPFYREGEEISGHEFRYSTIHSWDGTPDQLVFRMRRGVGFMDGRDGLTYKNVLALYTHVHAAGTPGWAAALVKKALEYKFAMA